MKKPATKAPTPQAVIHLIDVLPCGSSSGALGWWKARCACQWASRPKKTYEAANTSGRLHFEAARRKR